MVFWSCSSTVHPAASSDELGRRRVLHWSGSGYSPERVTDLKQPRAPEASCSVHWNVSSKSSFPSDSVEFYSTSDALWLQLQPNLPFTDVPGHSRARDTSLCLRSSRPTLLWEGGTVGDYFEALNNFFFYKLACVINRTRSIRLTAKVLKLNPDIQIKKEMFQ